MTVPGKRVLLLWDVDHTLIENSGVSKATYALAFEKLTGQVPTVQPSTDGRTDTEIMRNLFSANEMELKPYQEQRLFHALIKAGQELTDDLLLNGYILPGVVQALRRLSEQSGVVQSVMTGNIKPNADNKLKLLGDWAALLDTEVGGYGSDNIVRSRLVRVAQEKAGRKYGTTFDRSSTVLVGDTERDVWAARDGGAKIVGVATGTTSEDDLRNAGADVVLPDLTNVEAFLNALAELTGEPLAASA